MKWITAILSTAAAVLLILPALLLGSYGYALVVAGVSAAGVVLLHRMPQSKWSDMLLMATCAMASFALFLRIHTLFAVIALALYIYAWNAANRFGHLDRSPVEASAKKRFVRRLLVLSFIPSFGIGLLVTAFLYVRVPMTFGLGLGLSLGTLLTVALFVKLANAARRREGSDTNSITD